VHLSVKYSKPERMGTALWTVGRDRHFGQRGRPHGAVDAGSDITAYSLDWQDNPVNWHLVPLKERLKWERFSGWRVRELCRSKPGTAPK
jgi:hypothetical protein